jgi:hypothetical protein
MSKATELADRARMFEKRAETAIDRSSRQHFREMAAHYRSLSVEHREERAPLQRLAQQKFHAPQLDISPSSVPRAATCDVSAPVIGRRRRF